MRWLAEHTEEGEPTFRVGRDGEELVAEWVGLLVVRARRDGTYVIERAPDVDPRDIAKVEEGGVTLLLRHLRQELGLHGAAVAQGGRAIAFLGRGHQGKSTLAAALCRDGGNLLSDDAVALDRRADGSYVALGVERHHWLDAEACVATGITPTELAPRNGKAPVPAARRTAEARLVAMIDLRFREGAIKLERARRFEAMAALIPQVVRFVLDDPDVHRWEMNALAALVDKVPLFVLERPRSIERVGETAALVRGLLEAGELEATPR